jgi:hypothetical protein
MQAPVLNPARGAGGGPAASPVRAPLSSALPYADGYAPLRASVSSSYAVPVAPVPRASAGAPVRLARGMQDYAARASSTALLDTHAGAMARVPPPQRAAVAARRRADDARIQQLRGVFAAYDADGDGQLTVDQLALALLALGLQPTDATLSRFLLTATATAAAGSDARGGSPARPQQEQRVDLPSVSAARGRGTDDGQE